MAESPVSPMVFLNGLQLSNLGHFLFRGSLPEAMGGACVLWFLFLAFPCRRGLGLPLPVFKGQWCTPGEGLRPSYIIPGGGKGPFLFPYMFMTQCFPRPITSATVMADLIRCDGGSTTRAAGRAAEV